MLDFSVATIECYFRIEALTRAISGFANAGGEWGVLRSLVKEGAQTVPEIARARPVSRQHCQTIVNGLYEQGFVEFLDNPRHKRSVLVGVTKKGRTHFENVKKTFLGAAATYAHHFSAEEIALSTDVLKRAKENLVV